MLWETSWCFSLPPRDKVRKIQICRFLQGEVLSCDNVVFCKRFQKLRRGIGILFRKVGSGRFVARKPPPEIYQYRFGRKEWSQVNSQQAVQNGLLIALVRSGSERLMAYSILHLFPLLLIIAGEATWQGTCVHLVELLLYRLWQHPLAR